MELSVSRLASHPEALPVIAEWFRGEWPDWYGPGGAGVAEEDLLAYSNECSLPVGVVVFCDGALCGVAALKAKSIPSHSHLTPWAAAGFVLPALRGQGIGAALLSAVEVEARALGYKCIYCGTSTAVSLLRRAKWRLVETVQHEGKGVSIYEKAL
jgi:GNAT superfamily N-acetyltransferase